MTCNDALMLAKKYLAGDLPTDQQVEFGYHWLSCAACRRVILARQNGPRASAARVDFETAGPRRRLGVAHA